MRTYMRVFLNLLVPIALTVTLISIIYFNFKYDFSKALNIGILSGVLISVPVSLIGSLILLIMKKIKSTQNESLEIDKNRDDLIKFSTSNNTTPIEQKLMLLMHKDLAFEVTLFSITDQNLGEIATKETKEKDTITLRTYDGTIQIIISKLTRHTAQVIIKGLKNSQELHKIISFIKKTEYTLLQY